jgi:alpha-L-glutamate ligase-like protein
MFEYFKKSRKILGMNARNLQFIRPCNLKKARRIADNKLICKKVLEKNNIPVPKLISKISSIQELENFDWNSLPNSFALKPNRGFGGEGIIVVFGKKKGREDAWIKFDGSIITIEDFKNHIRNILDGSFSLSNSPDVAFFEERLLLLKTFKPYVFKGIPDIRVIVYNKVPVMAMLRVPTKESGGRANLQQGAIGIGIDLASGVTTTAVFRKNKIIEHLPGTRLALSGIKIPYWNDILKLAVRAQEVSGLGFLGADVAIDKEKGPVFLELNARPGLSIQIANLDGLKGRLERVRDIQIKTMERGVRVGMNLFGGEIQEEVEEISGRKIIGSIEKVKFIGKDEKEIEVEAKIDTGAQSSSIDIELAKELGFAEMLEEFSKIDLSLYNVSPENENQIKKEIMEKYKDKLIGLADVSVIFSASGSSIRPVVSLTFMLDKVSIIGKVNITDRNKMRYRMIVGKKNLSKFLIDVNKITKL